MVTDRGISSGEERAMPYQELFEKAESLFANGMWQPATELYEKIISMSDDDRIVTDEVVMSYFRIFYMTSETQSGNSEEMLRFIPFRHRLRDEYVLEGLYLLARSYAVLDRWDEARQYIAEMLTRAESLQRKLNGHRFRRRLPFRRSLTNYYGHALLMMSEGYEFEGAYAEAREYLERCFVLPQIHDALPEDKLEAERFSLLAQGRLLGLEVKNGHLERLPQLVDLMNEYPLLRVEGLTASLMAANKYKFSFDPDLKDMLYRFADSYPAFSLSGENQIRDRDRYSRMYYQCAVYWLNEGEHTQGALQLLRSIKLSLYLKNQHQLLASLMLYEKHLPHIPETISADIMKLCEERAKEVKVRFPWKQMLL
ncbi:hypothetical protein DMN77_19445 [Paenibacillus sp. 79R4]|uniref:hypothetical protein n=1 Tax=Paenibacillus sp. 79R4 TaxID=2212847 RepID=UPI0015BBDB6A|nr:hypothetical protein [Paenibacillus sp. 79R4]NWL89726.1 hypothetical protein [Paenibacillus sp. 79R4]